MSKTVFTGAHAHLVNVLINSRKKAGLTQAQLADRIGKDQRFISLIERCQRRVDLVEFYSLAKALGHSPEELFASVVKSFPEHIEL